MNYATSSIYNSVFGRERKRGGGINRNNSLYLDSSKKQFIILVFSNLLVQLGITYYVMTHYNANANAKDKKAMSSWMIFLFQIFLILVLAFVPMPAWLKFILFCVFSTGFGVLLSNLKNTVDSNIIQAAIVGALGIFAAMFAAGASLLIFGVQLGAKFGLGLLIALLLLICVYVVYMFLGTYSLATMALSVVGLFLFSLYILFDTNVIIQRNFGGDFITASLDYYLDIINIFAYLLDFMGNQ